MIKNIEKGLVTETIFRFYEYHKYDENGKNLGIASDKELYSNSNPKDITFEPVKSANHYGLGREDLNLNECLPYLNKVYEENKNNYSLIRLEIPSKDYSYDFRIVGTRKETDQEFADRKQDILNKEKNKLLKREELKALKDKKAQLKLKMESVLTDDEKKILNGKI